MSLFGNFFGSLFGGFGSGTDGGVNPASGLPMIEDSGVDVAGNPWGTDFSDSFNDPFQDTFQDMGGGCGFDDW
jgi:hypothetical protein